MSTPTETEIAYEAMDAANKAMNKAFIAKVHRSQDMASRSGVAWVRAFESEIYAAAEYTEARKAWEATVVTLIAAIQESVK
jgi:hypothetical protein